MAPVFFLSELVSVIQNFASVPQLLLDQLLSDFEVDWA